ncbi:protein of unknown function [Marinococcus luteus]|uniref:DUF4190 domain-containing protein n=1 Tax=Marinococcus luteus TaxID=1122204 RepID=A0A1H2WAV4_9BACI|nr:DUF4190 domain-containing protein [Marinococcus luteus]SDW77655.1 protein of unknown function [Marinococcus luteus]
MNETDTPATQRRSLKAIISLVLGFDAFIFLVILFPFSLIFGIIGLWTGLKALKDIKNYHYRGRKAALAGVIFSLIGIIVGAIITLNVFVL